MMPRTSLTNTNVFQRAATRSSMLSFSARQILACVLAFALLLPMLPQPVSAAQEQDAQASAPPSQAPPYTQQTPDQLQQLVAPIALYPDSLVAQVLAASTFPAEIVEADRWVQAHPDLKGDALAQAVDQQSWDPSVKALTAFPTVLGNMDKNISWTSSLGDAYYNQEQGVMDAIQFMRQKAQQAGNLKDTPQQTVQTQGSDIVIQPASPDVVYVPAYDPWLVYGYPVVAWPGWYPYPGIWFGGPSLFWGVGFGIGFYGGFGWGWGHWGVGWGGRNVIFNNNRYYSRSNTFYNRNNYYRGGGERGIANNVRGGVRGNPGENRGVYNRPGGRDTPFHGNTQAARGFDQSRGQSGTRSSGFSGYDHGGEARSYSSRGSSSFGGGGGGFRGGGGGGGHHR
ncbi:MAG TPA: DUF3300 domain-containing protein [Candidatus Acidoferrales bacterium]|nr:DUF3300 domain-containing protein [Candidatus Acidoferrales bacterium]